MRYAALVVAGLLAAWGTHAQTSVDYSLKPLLDAQGTLTAVQFEMRFKAAQAQTEVDLPEAWGGGRDFYKLFKDIEIDGATTVVTPPDQPAHRLITAAPGAEITVRYHVDANRKAGEEAPIDSDMTYPVIGPERFYILGQQVWPGVVSGGPLPATFHTDMPDGWTFASDLQDLEAIHGTDNDISQSVMMGGRDVHIDSVTTPHTRLRIASAGKFDFPLSDFDAKVAKIIETEQDFWGDGQPAFLVTLAPIESAPGRSSMRGTGQGDAFAMMTVPDMPVDRIAVTLSHEYFHSWNPFKLGGAMPDSEEATGYWFSEGFTDYYGRKLALRAGVVGLKAFVAEWNEALGRYAASPHRTAPNADVRDRFWSDEDWQKMPYDRGSILAALFDREWHDKGMTLDRFMLALRDRAVADPDFGKKIMVERAAAVSAALGVPVADELTRHIDNGEAIHLPADAFGGCLKVIDEEAYDFYTGYDVDKTIASGVFTGVDPDSNAYKAGIREGMKRLDRLSGDPADSTVPLSFRVADADGHESVISYLPQGKVHHPRQRLVIPDGLDAAALDACTAAVAAY